MLVLIILGDHKVWRNMFPLFVILIQFLNIIKQLVLHKKNNVSNYYIKYIFSKFIKKKRKKYLFQLKNKTSQHAEHATSRIQN